MGIMDAISSEDRVDVKFSDFYKLVKGCTQRDQLMNAIQCDVPHRYMREMMTGKSENYCVEEAISEDEATNSEG